MPQETNISDARVGMWVCIARWSRNKSIGEKGDYASRASGIGLGPRILGRVVNQFFFCVRGSLTFNWFFLLIRINNHDSPFLGINHSTNPEFVCCERNPKCGKPSVSLKERQYVFQRQEKEQGHAVYEAVSSWIVQWEEVRVGEIPGEKNEYYRAKKKSWFVVARNVFLLLLNFSAWPCLGPA